MDEQVIIPSGDEVTKRNIGVRKSSSNFEEKIIKLAGLNSFLSLTSTCDPDLKACIDTLNHALHAHEKLTVTKLNHFLVLLSLENLCLQNASTPPKHSFVDPLISPLLFDHPFDLEIVTDESSVVPFSEFGSSDWPTQLSSYRLQLEEPLHSLEGYSVLEVFEFSGLLQELRSLQFTHPYVEVLDHQHSESLILVVHTGFDGTPVHKHKLSSHTHTKVGFQNFLQFVHKRYGHRIDEAVEEDGRRRIEYEEERKAMAALKSEEKQKEVLATLEEEQVTDTGKTRKSGSKPLKKSIVSSNMVDTPGSSVSDLHCTETAMQPFQIEKRFTGYDMGDMVLLKESIHTTLFTSDGVQVQSKRHLMTNGAPEPCDISLLHNGHRVVCTQVWVSENSSPATDADTSVSLPTDTVIPQPPPELKSASLKACFNNFLHISCSYYGPKGNGEFPYLPHRPKLLDQHPQSDHLQPPATQPGVSPKLSKKQQEHQQQLLEQQRAQETQLEKERQGAKAKYQQQYDTLVRNNTHQRLSVSTEYGLMVQCHVSLDHVTNTADAGGADTDAADTVSGGGSIIIKQQYSHPEMVEQLNEHVSKERCRLYHPDGYVIKCMKDDSVIILSADGTRYRSATTKEAELFTKHKSKKIKDDAQPVKSRGKDELDTTEIDRATKRVSSSIKLKSADKAEREKVEKEKAVPLPVAPAITSVLAPQSKVWAMTTSAGNRYLFEETEETAMHDRSPELPQTPEKGNKENIDPAAAPRNAQGNRVVMPLSSIHLVKATDPITKEVSALNDIPNIQKK